MSKVTNFHNAPQDADLAWEEELKEERFMEKWNKRFGELPWTRRHAGTRKISGVASYVFNIASVIGLWYAVNVLIGPFLPVPYLSEIITTGLLVMFEITKRKFSDLFWDHWHQTYKPHLTYGAINFVVLFGISLIGSGFGVYFGVTDTSTDAKQIGVNDDPEAIALQDEITDIDRKIEQHSANRNREGVIFWPSQKAIEKLEAQRLENKEILKSKYGVYEVKNQTILNEWKIRKDFRAYFIIGLTILFELLFECCMSFNSKYDYIRGLNRNKAKQVSSPTPTPGGRKSLTPVPGDKLQKQLIREAIREELERSMPGPTSRGAEDSSYYVATSINDAEILDLSIKQLKSYRNAWKSNKGIKEDTRAQKISAIDKKIANYEALKEQLSATA